MSKTDSKAIQNAEEVIERFGGIRPMARKLNIAVTTVQGWKKRNVIPGNRYEDIVKAAQEHEVDISKFMRIDAANENVSNENVQDSAAAAQTMPEIETIVKNTRQILQEPVAKGQNEESPVTFGKNKFERHTAAHLAQGIIDKEELEMRLRAMELKAVLESSLISLLMVVIGAMAVVFLLWPQSEHNTRQIEELKTDMQIIKKAGDERASLLPSDLEQKFADLQNQAGAAAKRAEEIAGDVLAGNAQPLAGLMARVQDFQATADGQARLQESIAEISAILTSGTAHLDQKLADARAQNAALSQTLEAVPQEDLKAAAILLGFTQFRSSLNRNGAPFENDLAVLMQLVGNDNPELAASLQRLAPHAQSGVLTPEGVSNEFKTLAGDVIVASLQGQDVSFQEKAKARLNDLLQAQENGQPVTGGETQAKLARTQGYLNQGDLTAAIAEASTLQGQAALAVLPWMNKAQATLEAQRAQAMLEKTLGGASGLLGGQLVRDEASGINILKR